MKIEPITITIKDIYDGYLNDDENDGGVIGYGEQLNIRPPYQRNFVYDDKKRNMVIDTILRGLPLNVMYWVKNDDGTFEVLDGQQRTISFCEYLEGNFSFNGKYFHNLTKDKKKQIEDYELLIYVCEGTDSEKLDWFTTINIAGERLLDQELRNAVYYGTWLSDAKKFFSKRECIAKKIGERYMTGSPIRQDYLETVLDWITNGNIVQYMAQHQNDPNATELKLYYRAVIDWVDANFIKYRREMKGVEWGKIYNEYKNLPIDNQIFEQRISELMQDEDVTNKKGIYPYLFDGDEKHLSIRVFDNRMKREAYERQKGICAICGKHFELEQMEADHITAWSKGGTTTADNCQMLCKKCNRQKSNK
jgi:hypothetical protein